MRCCCKINKTLSQSELTFLSDPFSTECLKSITMWFQGELSGWNNFIFFICLWKNPLKTVLSFATGPCNQCCNCRWTTFIRKSRMSWNICRRFKYHYLSHRGLQFRGFNFEQVQNFCLTNYLKNLSQLIPSCLKSGRYCFRHIHGPNLPIIISKMYSSILNHKLVASCQ